mmetsp:Transcript_80324/g.215306  ORF Transcript_80324/g.215306 Transcript_80324/m.215306 type:complete len:243 (-) Transcript_80324:336-1064(-)
MHFVKGVYASRRCEDHDRQTRSQCLLSHRLSWIRAIHSNLCKLCRRNHGLVRSPYDFDQPGRPNAPRRKHPLANLFRHFFLCFLDRACGLGGCHASQPRVDTPDTRPHGRALRCQDAERGAGRGALRGDPHHGRGRGLEPSLLRLRGAQGHHVLLGGAACGLRLVVCQALPLHARQAHRHGGHPPPGGGQHRVGHRRGDVARDDGLADVAGHPPPLRHPLLLRHAVPHRGVDPQPQGRGAGR